MSRERWVYRTDPETGECIKYRVDADAPPEARVLFSTGRHYENTCATDGTDIGSKARRAEYMRRHNLADADDFKGTWAKARAERDALYTDGGDHAARREAIGRALYQLETKRRK